MELGLCPDLGFCILKWEVCQRPYVVESADSKRGKCNRSDLVSEACSWRGPRFGATYGRREVNAIVMAIFFNGLICSCQTSRQAMQQMESSNNVPEPSMIAQRIN